MTTEAAAQQNVLVLYGSPDRDWVAAIANKFEKDTGIKVQWIRASSNEMYAKIEAEKANPQGDVWFGGTGDPHFAAAEAGLTEPYCPRNFAELRERMRDPIGNCRAIGLYAGPLGWAVNEGVLKKMGKPMPQTWDDLTKPEYKGLIAISNPTTAGTAYTALVSILLLKGEDKGWEYLAKLHKNVAQYTKSGSAAGQLAGQGEVAIGIVFLHDSVMFAEEGFPVKPVAPADGKPLVPSTGSAQDASTGGGASASEVLEELREGLNSAYRQLRELLTTFRLRIEGEGLAAALQTTVAEFSARGDIPITLDVNLTGCPLSANEEIHTLQIVREALPNVLIHARARQRVEVGCDGDGSVLATVTDDGIGIRESAGAHHYGMTIMEERARPLGGQLSVETLPAQGTRVSLHFHARRAARNPHSPPARPSILTPTCNLKPPRPSSGRVLADVMQDGFVHLLFEDEGKDGHRLAAAAGLQSGKSGLY